MSIATKFDTPFGEVWLTVHSDDSLRLDADSITINRVAYRLRGHFIRGTGEAAKRYGFAADGRWYPHPQGFDIQKLNSSKPNDFSWNAFDKAKEALTDLVNAWDKTPEGWKLLSAATVTATEDKLTRARKAAEEARIAFEAAVAAVVILEGDLAAARATQTLIEQGVGAV